MSGSKYPGQIDTNIELPLSTDLVTPVNAEVVNNLRSAILAIENTLGVNPDGVFGTVSARLNFISTSILNNLLSFDPPINITKSIALAGNSALAARSDHKHDISTSSATSVGSINSEGSSSFLARADHTHAVTDLNIIGQQKGAVLYFNGSNWDKLNPGTDGYILTTHSAGQNPTWSLPLNGVILSTLAPTTTDKSTALVGVSTTAARSDHKHDISTAPAISIGASNTQGSATSLARSDHTHAVVDLNISGQTQGDLLYFNGTNWVRLAASTDGYVLTTHSTGQNPTWSVNSGSIGSSTSPNVNKSTPLVGVLNTAARSDHKHDIDTASAVSVGSTNTEGTATSLARSDHTHAVVDLKITGQAQGDTIYFNGTNWVKLAAGTDGYVLTTHSAGQNPTWSQVGNNYNLTGSRLPVRLTQGKEGSFATRSILYTYNAGTKTITFTANGPITLDGLTLIVGDSCSLPFEGINCGLWTCTQTGVLGSTPCKLVRRSDLAASSDFLSGVSFNVTDGNYFINTTWQLSTPGTIILDTTSFSFSPIRDHNYRIVDLSMPPYNIIGDSGLVHPDQAPMIQKFVDDGIAYYAASSGTISLGRLPGGLIVQSSPVCIWGNGVILEGEHKDATALFCNLLGCEQMRIGGTEPFTIGGTNVDTGYDSPLQMWHPTIHQQSPLLDISEAGARIDNRSQIRIQMFARFATLGGGGGGLYSLGGELHLQATRYCIRMYAVNTGQLVAVVRTIDQSTVYASGTSPPGGVSISGVPSGVILEWEMDSASTYRYAVNGGCWLEQGVPVGTTHTCLHALLAGATITMPASGFTYAVDSTIPPKPTVNNNSWKNWQYTTLASATGAIVANTNYQIAITYDASGGANNLKLHAWVAGTNVPSVGAAGSALATATTTGVISQMLYEKAYLGYEGNASLPTSEGGAPAQFWLGSFGYSSIVTALAAATTQNCDLFQTRFNSSQAYTCGAGIHAYACYATLRGSARGNSAVSCRRFSYAGGFIADSGLLNLRLRGTFQSAKTGARFESFKESYCQNVRADGGDIGLTFRGPSFFNHIGDLSANTNICDIMLEDTGDYNIHGDTICNGQGILLFVGGVDSYFGKVFLNPTAPCYSFLIVQVGTISAGQFALDDEDFGEGAWGGMVNLLTPSHTATRITGVINASYEYQPIVIRQPFAGNTCQGRIILDVIIGTGARAHEAIYIKDTQATSLAIDCSRASFEIYGFNTPRSNLDRILVPGGGKLKGPDLTNSTSQTISWADCAQRRRMTATTTTGVTTISLTNTFVDPSTGSTANVLEGSIFELTIEGQENNVIIADLASTTTLYTVIAGAFVQALKFEMGPTHNWRLY